MNRKRLFDLCRYFSIVAIVVVFSAMVLHCRTSGNPNPVKNSLGFVAYQDNPFAYTVGAVIGGQILRGDTGELFTQVEFNPVHTYLFFRETKMFCGDQRLKLIQSGTLLVTYQKIAHISLYGIGCHDLVDVTPIEAVTP